MDDQSEDAGRALATLMELASGLPADHLGEATFSVLHEEVYLALMAEHEDWETVLGLALKTALVLAETARTSASSSSSSGSSSSTSAHPEVPRESSDEALRPLLAFAHGGRLLRVESLGIAVAQGLAAPAPVDEYPLEVLPACVRFFDEDDAAVVVSITEDGMAYGWDRRLIPNASDGEHARNLGDGAGVSAWATLCDRRAMRQAARVLCVTREGQVKASDQDAFGKVITSTGYAITGVSEGDAVVEVLLEGRAGAEIMLLASNGYAIRFDTSDVRSMGLKAGGVRGINLRGDARVVSALMCGEREQVAMVTEQGYGLRCLMEEFRPQSRGGLGLIAVKLANQDALVSSVTCDFNSDLVVLTSHGRALRVPTGAWSLQGRATRGDRVVELAEGERVVDLTRLEPL